ncbi:MAG TPA: alpha/beta fold hydrolase [Candidatus Limnocylindria bacterium]|jgi:pimeloyl-ACP methyl ester carboxylesterase|nr:alpha/beta fold hydrolase [Candidatus Limnocylindria bacterium]
MEPPAGRSTFVTSADGTRIHVSTAGSGPPLVLVHGTAGNHARWLGLRPLLEARLTVHALDRRGRGASGDAADYDIAREFEDVAAVVDAVAAASDEPVAVYGHSFGGLCALAATGLTRRIDRLVLYEPPSTVDDGSQRLPLAQLVAAGRREEALETFLRVEVGMSDDELAALREMSDWWQPRLAMIDTIVREYEADLAQALTTARLEDGAPPTLLLIGSDSPADYRTELSALAQRYGWQLAALAGQAHIADISAPELVAEPLLNFVLG